MLTEPLLRIVTASRVIGWIQIGLGMVVALLLFAAWSNGYPLHRITWIESAVRLTWLLGTGVTFVVLAGRMQAGGSLAAIAICVMAWLYLAAQAAGAFILVVAAPVQALLGIAPAFYLAVRCYAGWSEVRHFRRAVLRRAAPAQGFEVIPAQSTPAFGMAGARIPPRPNLGPASRKPR